MITDQTILSNLEAVELKPNFNICLVLILAAVPLSLFQLWLGLPVGLFGIFLLVQTMTLRLRFTAESLEIYRLEKMIRNFPYSQWEYSEIFWPRLPVLFYFREVNSIHFLPILFDPQALTSCLAKYPCHFKTYNISE